MSVDVKDIFAFGIGQLVMLELGVQGQVSARHDFGHREPEYQVQYLQSKTYNSIGVLLSATRVISESDLSKLQPGEMVPRAEFESKAAIAIAGARVAGRHDMAHEIARAKQDRAAARKLRKLKRARKGRSSKRGHGF